VFNTDRIVEGANNSNNTAKGERPFNRCFASVLHAGLNWDDDIERFYDIMLPHVPRAPNWTMQISLSSFDFLTANGSTWQNDVAWFSERLSRADRNRIVFAQQGWYDQYGDYSYNASTDSFDSVWTFSSNSPAQGANGAWDCSKCVQCCLGPGQWHGDTPEQKPGTPLVWAIPWSVQQTRALYNLAQDAGIRTIHYFGDGLAICKNSRRYLAGGVATLEIDGYLVSGTSDCVCPEGSKGAGCSTILNPLDPANRKWFLQYMKALLRTFGDTIDGFVWDETFYINPTAALNKEAGGYAAQAMLTLTEELTQLVHEYNNSMVFLASDIFNIGSPPPYSMVTDGNFADFETAVNLWPSYRATQGRRMNTWSCDWVGAPNLQPSEVSLAQFGAVPSVGYCYHTQGPRGVSNYSPEQQSTVIRLFAEHKDLGVQDDHCVA